METIHIGPVPSLERCASVGDADFEKVSRQECWTFRRMMERHFPVPEGMDARFAVRSFPHEFGSYREVVVDYEPSDEKALAFALHCEHHTPDQWDVLALYDLLWIGRSESYKAALKRGEIAETDIPSGYRGGSPPPAQGENLAQMIAALDAVVPA